MEALNYAKNIFSMANLIALLKSLNFAHKLAPYRTIKAVSVHLQKLYEFGRVIATGLRRFHVDFK